MKRFALIIGFLLAVSTIAISPVTAQTKYDVPLSCDVKALDFKPYEQLVVVDLTKYLSGGGSNAQDLHRYIFYEFVYVRNRKQSPFNAVYFDGKLYMQNCDEKDVSARIISDSQKGSFIVGTLGPLGTELQSKIEDNNLVSFKQADITQTDNGVKLVNMQDCTDLCKALKPATKSWKEREYSLSVEKVNSLEKIGQKDYLDVSVIIKNDGKNPFYGEVVTPLYVTTPSKSAFYDPTWVAAQKPQKLAGVLLPDGEAELKFRLTTPMIPGSYEQKFGFAIGDKALAGDFKTAFTVENNNLKLGVIRPKDNLPFARVRETESLTSTELFRLDKGEVIIIEKTDGAWYFIRTKSGQSGWMYRPNVHEL